METNWNQLIERYLQNELSEEGTHAFEQELQLNPALREELEMHRLIQSAAKRASQRTLVQQAGKAYLRNLRIKQFTIGVVVTAAATVGVVYWVQSKKQAETPKPQQELVVENLQQIEEPAAEEKVLPVPEDLQKDSVSTIQDGTAIAGEQVRNTVSHTRAKVKTTANTLEVVKKNDPVELKQIPVTFRADSAPGPGIPGKVEGTVFIKQEEEPVPNSGWADWSNLYDSVGRFNDLYCGYALVMDDAKIGFVDRKGNVFIPLIYDQIIVTSNIQSSKDKHKKKGKKKVLYIPKRSGSEVQYCEENNHPLLESEPVKKRKP